MLKNQSKMRIPQLFQNKKNMARTKKHMMHLYEDASLTFGEISEICKAAVLGKLRNVVTNISEKTDGQNMLVTVADGKVKLAIGNGTELTIESINDRYKDKRDILECFTHVYQDLTKAFTRMNCNYLDSIFRNGERYINMEVIDPATRNVIYYGKQPILQFHNVIEIKNGIRTSAKLDEGFIDTLYSASYNKNLKYHFTFINPTRLTFAEGRLPNLTAAKLFEKRLAKKMFVLNLNNNSTIREYYVESFKLIVNKQFPYLSKESKLHLVNRWGYVDRSYRISSKTIRESSHLQGVKDFDIKAWKLASALKNELKELILVIGQHTINLIENGICKEIEESKRILENDLLEFSKDENFMETFKDKGDMILYYKELYLKLGGLHNYRPVEGVVFEYNDQQYKLTGVFTPINQLLGLKKYEKKI